MQLIFVTFGLSFNKKNYNMYTTLYFKTLQDLMYTVLYEPDHFIIQGPNTDHWSLVYEPRNKHFKLKGTVYVAQREKEYTLVQKYSEHIRKSVTAQWQTFKIHSSMLCPDSMS